MKTTATSIEALWNRWSAGLSEDLLKQDGIKAQFAAATAVVTFLGQQHKNGNWRFLAVPVGSFEDRALGIDGYLVNGETKTVYAVDFSLEAQNNPKGNKATAKWLVHLKREWFEQRPDGIWVMRPSCLSALFRAFLPTLQAGPVQWQPLFEV